MILKEFSKYLQDNSENITAGKTSTTKLLCEWIKLVKTKNPQNNAEKIVHKEIMLAQNGIGDFFITGTSPSGRVLVNALYNYALSYEHYVMSKWLSDKNPKDFEK